MDLRRNLRKKIIIVREQSTLINLVYSFFPDVFIYNIEIEEANSLGKRSLLISFLTFRDRCIAIGRNGEYIKAINQLLENYIKFQNNNSKIKIKCKVADHYELYKNLNINISI